MPMIVLSAAASAGFGALAGGTFLGFAAASWEAIGLRFATGLLLGGLSQALSPKPKKPSALTTPVQNNTVTVRQSDVARRHVYGHTRVTSCYAYVNVTGDNQYLHQVIILCDGELESIDEVWADDYVIPPDWIDSSGNVTQGRYAGYLRIKKYLGTTTQAADADLIGENSDLDSNFQLRGIAYLYVRMLKNQDVFPSGAPNFSAIVKGRKIYDPRSGMNAFTPNAPLFNNDYLSNSTIGFGAADADNDLDGVAAEATVADEIVDTVDYSIGVTAVDTATGILTLDATLLPFQLGDRVSIASIASPGLPGGTSDAVDYYIIPYQVGTTPRVKLATSLANAIAGTAISISSAGDVSASSPDNVTLTRTGEPRYHGAGVIDTSQTLSDNFTSLLAAIAGRAVNIGGKWRLLSGIWREPDITLTLSDLVGPVSVPTKVSMSSRANVIQGQFVSSINNYQPSNYPTLRSSTFITQDNDLEYPATLNLPFTNRSAAAQRIAKIELLRNRQEIVVTTSASLKVLQAQPGDTVMLTIDRYGWSAKIFEITSMGLNFGSQNNAALTVDIALRETDSSIYDWTTDEESAVDPAPNSNLPDPFTVDAPADVAYDSRQITTTGGDTVYNMVLTWSAPSNLFISAGGWFDIQFKLSSDTDWRTFPPVRGDQTSADILSTSVEVEYDLRIRAVNSLGVRSSWQTIANAMLGSSGGVTFTLDWGSVADSVGTSNDWGSVADPVGSTNDWGSVT